MARRVVPLLRTFVVFNAQQIEGLPSAAPQGAGDELTWDPIETADSVVASSGARLIHGGDRAFYAPGDDEIHLPARSAFASSSDYYGTALHELVHWTGHADRCNRPLGIRHGVEAYAFEELVAEIGAAFLTNHCGLEGRLQHASYVSSWLQALRNDKRLIFSAASLAQKAADYLLPAPAEAAAEVPLALAA